MHWILFLVHIICFAPKNLIGGLYALRLRRIQRAMFFSLWTCKNHHFVVSNLCIPIEHGHIKMAQILFKSKTRHSWWPGLEVVSERASWGNFYVFGMRLLRWQLMTTDARSRSKLHLIPPRSCQKLPEAAETHTALRHRSQHLCMVHLMPERLTRREKWCQIKLETNLLKNDTKSVLQRSSAAGIVPDLLRQDCSLAWPPRRLASPDQIEELEISLKRK